MFYIKYIIASIVFILFNKIKGYYPMFLSVKIVYLST
jgi:hypothetical protein